MPRRKKNHTPNEAMEDKSFYIELHDGKPALKKDHHFGYYTQIQVTMGFCDAQPCHFVVYFLKGIIIVRVPFDEAYFKKVESKLSEVYMKWYLAQLMEPNSK